MSKEKALMLFDWYDKPISGVAEMNGAKVVFERIYLEDSEDYTDSFYLTELGEDQYEVLVPLWEAYVRDGAKFSFYDVIDGVSFRRTRVHATFSGRRPDLEVISDELFVEWGEVEEMSEYEAWSNQALLILKKFLKCEWYDLADVKPSGFAFRVGDKDESTSSKTTRLAELVDSFEGELKWKCYKSLGSSLDLYEVQIQEKYEQVKESYDSGERITFGAKYGDEARVLSEKSARDISRLVAYLAKKLM